MHDTFYPILSFCFPFLYPIPHPFQQSVQSSTQPSRLFQKVHPSESDAMFPDTQVSNSLSEELPDNSTRTPTRTTGSWQSSAPSSPTRETTSVPPVIQIPELQSIRLLQQFMLPMLPDHQSSMLVSCLKNLSLSYLSLSILHDFLAV